MRGMDRGHFRSLGLGGLVLLAGALVPDSADAAIPYDTLLTPGELRGIAYAPGDPWQYGYWEYLPENFEEHAPGTLPLLVFMPGIGEYDDVSSCPGGADVCAASDCGSDGLCRNLTWGPQQLMRLGNWDDSLRPFIMVSPQHNVPPFSTTQWDLSRLDDFIQFIVDEYEVDQRRMYLIGMSQGGRGTMQYTQAYPRRFTAVAPAPGGQVDAYATCYFEDTALWIFHGENDTNGLLGSGVFSPCTMVGYGYQYENPGMYPGSAQCAAIVGQPRPEGRLTMYYDVGHFAWVQTVDPINSGFPQAEWDSDQGCGIPATFRQYSAALDPDGVYSWFLSLDRPRAEAPEDLTIDAPEVSLTATITDLDAYTVEWSQLGGPPATLNGVNNETLDVSDLLEGEQYTFQVYVLDADDQWDYDEVIVTVDPFAGGGSSGSGSSGGGTTGDGGTTGVGSTGGKGDTTGFGGDDFTGDGTGQPTSGGTSVGTTTTATEGDPDATAGPTTAGGSGGMATSAGPGTGDSGGETDDPGAGTDDPGCSCRADGSSPAGWSAWALLVLTLRRRRERARA